MSIQYILNIQYLLFSRAFLFYLHFYWVVRISHTSSLQDHAVFNQFIQTSKTISLSLRVALPFTSLLLQCLLLFEQPAVLHSGKVLEITQSLTAKVNNSNVDEAHFLMVNLVRVKVRTVKSSHLVGRRVYIISWKNLMSDSAENLTIQQCINDDQKS